MSTLLELYQKYSDQNRQTKFVTDKNSCHSYIEDVYRHFFEPYRNEEIDLLEIGVAYSGSIRLFNEYFSKGNIYGIDPFLPDPMTESWGPGETPKEVSWDLIENPPAGIHIIVDDAYQETVAEKLPTFDFIIDDGPHTPESQANCTKIYLPKLKSNGVMFIEDIFIDWGFYVEHPEGKETIEHPTLQLILENVPNDLYEYKLFDLRGNVKGRPGNCPEKGRVDNVILAIKHKNDLGWVL
tara:strand:+ start:264 stop:980 length:717 start_codon:yes stop_codon:yes gene_type:complete